ncbi:MAG: 1-acyl-sn-glycerol-3-phosphate acyltransferase [Treponema sp.]|nr:1-acyl-sn-glycerol-3-phosphate acyltransferase [Treponema sp.]MBQ7619630.1 1-acyl-sn-glycerol-3-phosphate acyltransferase [Treponema sp.]
MAEKDPGRLAILQKIDELERKRLWSHDVEDDPPTVPLEPDQIDYTKSKLSSKIKTWAANIVGTKFIASLFKNKQLIIKDVVGMENFFAVKDKGLIVTCNHFNAFDNFAVLEILKPYTRRHILWRVIREGNYTSFPGLYGFLFRNCNTLPVSQNHSTMKKFFEGMKTLLARGEKILVYAEQGMWWNYRKPRPMTNGAFKFAVDNNVPVLPIFITMTDSDIIGADGFPIQEYTMNVLPAIFADPNKSEKQNIRDMNEKNYKAWVDCYEKFYGKKLEYLPEEKQ